MNRSGGLTRRSGTDRSILFIIMTENTESQEKTPEDPDKDWKPGEKKEKPKYKRKPMTYPNRLLRALETVYEDKQASRAEKLQAIQLSLDVIAIRPIPKRKTDKDRAIEKLLGAGKKKPEKTE